MLSSRLKTRLRRRKIEEIRPTPVYLWFDSLVMTADDAIVAADRARILPKNAVLVVLPEQIQDRETWQRVCQAEFAARERQRLEQQQQREQAGNGPAES